MYLAVPIHTCLIKSLNFKLNEQDMFCSNINWTRITQIMTCLPTHLINFNLHTYMYTKRHVLINRIPQHIVMACIVELLIKFPLLRLRNSRWKKAPVYRLLDFRYIDTFSLFILYNSVKSIFMNKYDVDSNTYMYMY